MFEDKFVYLNININDNWNTDLFLVIYVILDFLNAALKLHKGKVLVHCFMVIKYLHDLKKLIVFSRAIYYKILED